MKFNLQTGGAFRGALAQSLIGEVSLPGLAPGERIGAFRIERELGRGGMSRVYLADRVDGEFSQQVALKWMLPCGDVTSMESLFRRERDILARLEHPGIARLLDGGRTENGILWFAMEYVQGEQIDQWRLRTQPPLDELLQRVVELCDALIFAHANLLVHRDIKPANVLVDQHGRSRLLDFGIAKLADQTELQGNLALTPGFASPEQWQGDTVTVASDVYQTGLLLALLCAPWPLPGNTTHATSIWDNPRTPDAVQRIADVQLCNLPADLRCIIRRATALQPEQRYASIDGFRDDLLRLLAKRPVAARNGGGIYQFRCLLRRQPWASAAVAVAGVVLVASTAIAIQGQREARAAAAHALAAEATASATNDFLLSIFNAPDPRNNPGLDVTARELLERGIHQLDTLKSEPAVQARMLAALGHVTWTLGDYDRANSLIERAIQLFDSHGISDPARLAALLDRRGGLLRDRSDLPAAEQSYRRALQVLADGRLDRSTDAAPIWSNLGIVLRRMGRLDDAASAYENTLRIVDELGMPPNSSVLSNLGAVEQSRGNYAAAISRYSQSEAALPVETPPFHPSRGVLAANLAVAHRQSGHLALAASYSNRALAIEEHSLGPDHPDLIETLQGLAATEMRQSRWDKADQHLQRASDLVRRHLGATHPRGIPVWLGQIHLAQLRNRPSDALALAEQAASAFPAGNTPPLRTSGTFARERAVALRRLGRHSDALTAAQQASEIAKTVGHKSDQAISELLIALILWDLGETSRSESMWQTAQHDAECADQPCMLDQAESLVLRSEAWLQRDNVAQAIATLRLAIQHGQWTHSMLEMGELEPLHKATTWAFLLADLQRRIDMDVDQNTPD